MNPRTIKDFEYSGDIGPIVDGWAAENGFRFLKGTGSARLFQRGRGFWTAPVRLEASQDGLKVHLEAWVSVNLMVRIMALFMLPKQMAVESGGFRGTLPRKIGRQRVNGLLEKLGQPPIA
jgi:hypothetical protein